MPTGHEIEHRRRNRGAHNDLCTGAVGVDPVAPFERHVFLEDVARPAPGEGGLRKRDCAVDLLVVGIRHVERQTAQLPAGREGLSGDVLQLIEQVFGVVPEDGVGFAGEVRVFFSFDQGE